MSSGSDNITPLILTYNEEPNIGRTLERLTWARQIIIIDSYSTDRTLEIVQKFSQVKVIQRKFDSFASQCNFGLQHINTSWVLSLDADYVLSLALSEEIQQIKLQNSSGYKVNFKYCVNGKILRGTLYPPRIVLYKRDAAHYQNDGHGHRVYVQGAISSLHSPIYHDDRKSFSRWLQSQNRYMVKEVDKLSHIPHSQLGRADRIRKTKIWAPIIVFFYCLFAKGLIFDGWAGWYYTLQRVLAEIILMIQLIEAEKLIPPNNTRT